MRIGVIGLCFDLVGVIIIAIPATRFVAWPVVGRVGNSKKMKKAKRTLYSQNRLTENDDYFNLLLPLLRKEYGEFDISQSPNTITVRDRLDSGTVVAVVYDTNGEKDEEIIGPVALVDNWIETSIERTYLKWGLLCVSFGFALQIISRVV